MSEHNIRNFSIFLHGDLLFGYYEYIGEDHDADQTRIAADPETRRWWALTDPCQESPTAPGSDVRWEPMQEVWHLTPDGVHDEVIEVPVGMVTACTFGGPDLDQLFITTSRENVPPGEDPLAGSLFRADIGVRGLPVREFAG